VLLFTHERHALADRPGMVDQESPLLQRNGATMAKKIGWYDDLRHTLTWCQVKHMRHTPWQSSD